MADQKEFKLLPTGGDTFSEIITQNKYYVDKTSYLRSVFTEDGSSVLLFTRPRRFGKTSLMDMFADFFRLNYLNPSDTSFKRKSLMIWRSRKIKRLLKSTWGSLPLFQFH